MASIVYTVILLVSFLFLVWKKDDTESYFPLKIIGYFVLGSFAFNFNQISLPLGFIAYLLFFRPKLNVHVKRIAAILGVLAFILIHWILPSAINEWESRPIFIEHELGSVYTMNFQNEYELIKQELNLENNSLRLEDFEVDYVEDGRITDLRWQLLVQNGNSYNLYQIQYDVSKSRYRVMYRQLDTWLQYNRLIDTDHFFEILNVLNIKDITHVKNDFSSYVIQSSGERVNYAIENQTHFIVSNGKIQLLDVEQLPVEAYYISTFAMEKTGEERDKKGNITQESFEGNEASDYLFDVKFGEK
ncbi:hypothetical protein [Neobacillus sp. OS1-33]|uniref:hypothetical protein n=1 Tax=Neobacillus sp. OS1-33 TaxID=3070683 RepID=UPI0027DFA2A8|nr:hypothetical protein [Neobacillus sp. OS1-33]WML26206.1 hypothetical protein RCG22_00720 [Neobacillus sp. OS1-33]